MTLAAVSWAHTILFSFFFDAIFPFWEDCIPFTPVKTAFQNTLPVMRVLSVERCFKRHYKILSSKQSEFKCKRQCNGPLGGDRVSNFEKSCTWATIKRTAVLKMEKCFCMSEDRLPFLKRAVKLPVNGDVILDFGVVGDRGYYRWCVYGGAVFANMRLSRKRQSPCVQKILSLLPSNFRIINVAWITFSCWCKGSSVYSWLFGHIFHHFSRKQCHICTLFVTLFLPC